MPKIGLITQERSQCSCWVYHTQAAQARFVRVYQNAASLVILHLFRSESTKPARLALACYNKF